LQFSSSKNSRSSSKYIQKNSRNVVKNVLKNKTVQKKHFYNSNLNTNSTNRIKLTTQIERKNILTINEYKRISTHKQHEIRGMKFAKTFKRRTLE